LPEQALMVQATSPRIDVRMASVFATHRSVSRGPSWKATLAAALRTLDLSRRILGTEHQDSFRWMSNVAVSLLPGDAALALKLHRWTVATACDVLGSRHPRTLYCQHNLALSLYAYGAKDEALALLREVAENRELTLGPDHPHTRISLAALDRHRKARDGTVVLINSPCGGLLPDDPRPEAAIEGDVVSVPASWTDDRPFPPREPRLHADKTETPAEMATADD
jgi:Tetratricopeptide repeat